MDNIYGGIIDCLFIEAFKVLKKIWYLILFIYHIYKLVEVLKSQHYSSKQTSFEVDTEVANAIVSSFYIVPRFYISSTLQ